jgi:hypothetical protein
MIEQVLMHHIIAIARDFARQGNTDYAGLAARFRFPYWEPFRPRSAAGSALSYGLPHVLSVSKIRVWRPGGGEDGEIVRNPLYQYQFPTPDNLKAYLSSLGSLGSTEVSTLVDNFFESLGDASSPTVSQSPALALACPPTV